MSSWTKALGNRIIYYAAYYAVYANKICTFKTAVYLQVVIGINLLKCEFNLGGKVAVRDVFKYM